MGSVGIRELQRDTSGIVGRVARTGRPTFVTNRGEAVAAVVPVDPEALEDFVLANAPAFVRAMAAADLELAEGRTRSSGDVFADLGSSRGPATVAPKSSPAPSPLTARERQILELLAEGRTNHQIAEHLGITHNTTRQHLRRLFKKLEATTRTAAVPIRPASAAHS